MILYSLVCAHGHVFDEWFANSGEYETRQAGGELACPECGDRAVEKAIMAPKVGKAKAPPAPRCTPGGCQSCAFAGHD